MNQKHISVSLGDKLMTAFQENKILRTVNKSALVRNAVSEYLERNLDLDEKSEKRESKNKNLKEG